MKRFLVIALSAFAGLAEAQSVDWNRVRATCSSEVSAYDAVRGTGDTSHQAMRFLETEAGSPPSAAKLRTLMESQRAQLSDEYLIKTPAFRHSAVMYVCAATAALNQLQSGSTQTTQRAPAPAQIAPSSQNDPQEDSLQCVRGLSSEKVIFNGCRMGVNLVWCAVPGSGRTPNVNCESQQFSAANLSPGSRVSVEDNFQIAWTMCDAPKQPVNVRYFSGRGLEGKCRR